MNFSFSHWKPKIILNLYKKFRTHFSCIVLDKKNINYTAPISKNNNKQQIQAQSIKENNISQENMEIDNEDENNMDDNAEIDNNEGSENIENNEVNQSLEEEKVNTSSKINKNVYKNNELHNTIITESLYSLPCRESEQNTIYEFIKNGLNTHGAYFGLYISGMPGTGKTESVTQTLNKLELEKVIDKVPWFNYIYL